MGIIGYIYVVKLCKIITVIVATPYLAPAITYKNWYAADW